MRTHFRFVTIALVVSLIVINYIDRSAVSFAVRPLSEAFGLNAASYGIIGGVFSVGYMVFAFLAGPLVDRFGPRNVLLGAVLVWSAATALTPLAGGFAGLLLVRILLGAGEAPGFPAATRVASRWLPGTERGKALALIGGVAVSGSLLISGPIITQLIQATGWRGMFWILAVLGLAWSAVAFVLLRNTPAEHPRCSAEERTYIAAGQADNEGTDRQERIDWRSILTNRNLWITGIGYFAWGFMFWGFMYWLPEYLATSYKLSIRQVGAFSVAPWAAGLVGALIGGVLVDRIYARSRRVRSRFLVMGTALLLSGAALIPIAVSPSLTTALISISLGVGLGFVTGGIWWVAAIDAAPDQPASAAGFADAAFASSGIVAPVVMGFIVSSTGTFTSGFVLMSALAAVGALAMLLFTREPRPSVGEAASRGDSPRPGSEAIWAPRGRLDDPRDTP